MRARQATSASADADQQRAARRALGLPAEGLVVGCVGSISAEKRVQLAVEAVAGVDDAVLLVVGDGPDRAAVEESAGAMLGERAKFTGQLESVTDVYAAIDVLLLTSATEGMPGVMIEAAMSGVPVVAPDVGAVRWLFDNGVHGEAVSGGRHGAGVLRCDRAGHASCREAPRPVLLQACTWDTVVEQWTSILGSGLGSRGARGCSVNAVTRLGRMVSPRHRRWQRLLDSCTIDPDALPTTAANRRVRGT